MRVTVLIAGGFLVVLLLLTLVVFIKRDALLRAAIVRAKAKAKADYALDVTIENAGFRGLKTVHIGSIVVVPERRDSLARLNNLSVSVRFFPLLFGKIKLAEVGLAGARINLVKRDSVANYDFLFRKKKKTESTSKASLARLADNLLNNLLSAVPDEMNVSNVDVRFTSDTTRLRLFLPASSIHNGTLQAEVRLNDNQSTWHFTGELDADDRQFDIVMYADKKKVQIPLIDAKYNFIVAFDEARINLRNVDRDGDELRLKAVCSVKNLLVNQPRLASNNIVVPHGSIDAQVLVGENFIELDSASVIHLEKISANPYLRYTLSPVKIYELGLHTGELDAQELFDAFPHGMFESLEGMKVRGTLQYDLHCRLDASIPDSVQFSSSMNKSADFKILRWGRSNLQKINGDFVHTPYERGKPVRSILIGPGNPDFIAVDGIAPDLRNAILTAEDPTFYRHRGFVELAIRRSIATDFKEKAFKQGGSTISMQLVKNVYLNRQKTMSRKIEEILIVWLIENNRLSSKHRMFEAYLNLIEWGPNIYGITEASRYYFGKTPAELSLGESIFLASIVPRPKKAMYFFQPDGSLRQSLHGYFRMIGGLMARRGQAARDSAGDYGFYGVRLRAGLRTLITPDTLLNDSTLMIPDEDENTDLFLDRVLNRKPVEKRLDTVSISDLNKVLTTPKDTVPARPLTRKEKREARKKEKEEKKQREKNTP